MIDTEQFQGELYPYEISDDGLWTLPDGQKIHITDIQIETPQGESAWVVAACNDTDRFPVCLYCNEKKDDNIILLLDNNEYIYMSRCCERVAFCKDKGEDNE